MPGGGGNLGTVHRNHKLVGKYRPTKWYRRFTAEQIIRNREFIEIPLDHTPAGSLIVAVDVAGRAVKTWETPEKTLSLKVEVSLFEKGVYTFIRPVRAEKGYELKEFYFYKRENPLALSNFKVVPLRGRFTIKLTPERLLPERVFEKDEFNSSSIFSESISKDENAALCLITSLMAFFARRARTAVAFIAILFAFFIVAPVTLADEKGGDTNKGGVTGYGERGSPEKGYSITVKRGSFSKLTGGRAPPRQRPFETASAESDTFECSLTGIVQIYCEDPYTLPYDTTYYDDIPFAYQDSSGNLIDQYAFEDTTGPSGYPAFFVEEIRPPNPTGIPNMYEVLFRYRNKTLTEIGEEMDSLNTYHGTGVTMEITINDSTSNEWLRATVVKWDEYWEDPPYPRCIGPPSYYWVDITPENPSRTFDDDFLFFSIWFSSDNPLDSGSHFFVNLNYIRELVNPDTSFTIDTNEVCFLDLDRGDISVSADTQKIKVTNDGDIDIDLGLSVDSVQYFTLLDSFYDPEADTAHAYCYGCYSLMAIFADSIFSPSPDSFGTSDFVTYDTTFADSLIFGPGGYGLPPDSSVYLWFRFNAPEYYPLDSLALPVHLHIRQAEE